MNNLICADDTVLIAGKNKDLQKLVDIMNVKKRGDGTRSKREENRNRGSVTPPPQSVIPKSSVMLNETVLRQGKQVQMPRNLRKAICLHVRVMDSA